MMTAQARLPARCTTKNGSHFLCSAGTFHAGAPAGEIARRVDTAMRLQRKEIEDDSRLATQLRDSQRKVTQLQERNKKQAAQIQALKEERKALKTELKATKAPAPPGLVSAHLHLWHWFRPPEKKLRRLLGKEK